MNLNHKYARIGLESDNTKNLIFPKKIRKMSENKKDLKNQKEHNLDPFRNSKTSSFFYQNKNTNLNSSIHNRMRLNSLKKNRFKPNVEQLNIKAKEKFTIETGNDKKQNISESLKINSNDNKSNPISKLKERKRMISYEKLKIKDQVNTTVTDIEKIKRNYSSKNSLSNLNKYSMNNSEKFTSINKKKTINKPKNEENLLDSFWEKMKRRDYEDLKPKIIISGNVQKEIDRRMKHRNKLEEAIELFNRKPKKGYLELLNVNPIYHAKKEIGLKNLTKFFFFSEKISKKR
jgi:hypothetical protein